MTIVAREEAMMDSDENPLLNNDLPHNAIPFGKIKPHHILEAIHYSNKEAMKIFHKIMNNPEPPTFENTIKPYMAADDIAKRATKAYALINYTNRTADFTAIEQSVKNDFKEHVIATLELDRLAEKIQHVHQNSAHLSPSDARAARIAANTFNDPYRKMNAEQKERCIEIDISLNELTSTFEKNLLSASVEWSHIINDPNELDGVSEQVKQNLLLTAQNAGLPEGSMLLTMHNDNGEILHVCHNRALREIRYRASLQSSKNPEFDNGPIILKIIELRHEMAQLNGYKNYAAMTLEDRMLNNAEIVKTFLSNLAQSLPLNNTDKKSDDVKEFAASKGCTDFKAWDRSYYETQMLRSDPKYQNWSLLNNVVMPYFEMEQSIQAVFDHAEKLYGVKFIETHNKYPGIHSDTRVYEAVNQRTNSPLGLMYLDLYARPGLKPAGGRMVPINAHHIDQNGQTINPQVAIIMNLRKPAPGNGVLLSANQIKTFMHEMGHCIHMLSGKSDHTSLSGINVPFDFIELPSKMNENWAMQKDFYKSFAKHYSTGEVIPDGILERLLKSDEDLDSKTVREQIFKSILDILWHSKDPKEIESIRDVETEALKLSGLFNKNSKNRGLASLGFRHIFVGSYAAGYYSYLWSNELQKDIFEEKFKDDPYNQENARNYYDKILSKGNEADPMTLFKDFMGREPKILSSFNSAADANQASASNDNDKAAQAPPSKPQQGLQQNAP